MNSTYLSQSFGLQGRTALVTGSARGIGLAIATALGQREGFEDFLRQEVPQARWAIPKDIAPVVLFLVSPAAVCVNGLTLAIDGGLLAQM